MNGNCLNPPQGTRFLRISNGEPILLCKPSGVLRDIQELHSCRSRWTQRRLLGMCASGKAWGELRSAACARKVVGMSALVRPALQAWSVCAR